MKKPLVLALALGLFFQAQQGFAQQPVVTLPSASSSQDGSGTIGSTGVFQSVFAASRTNPPTSRHDCLVVNTSTHVQYVFPGPIASATTANSIPLNAAPGAGQAGGTFQCSSPAGSSLQDQISITGTTADTFVAKQN